MIYFYSILISITSLFLFRRLLNINFKIDIPSGAGTLFVFNILALIIVEDSYSVILIIISILSLIYIVDDIFHLNFFIRIILQLCTGLIIFLFYYVDNLNNYLLIFLLCIVFIFFYTNLFNFNDGANLHVVSIFLQISIFLLFFATNITLFYHELIISYIIFLTIFAYYNKSNYLYLGDSGCFLFSCIILILLINNYSERNICIFLYSVSFYSVDVLYVLFLRILKKENLLSRNYYHLYQNLQINYINRYYYLIPGFLFNIIIFSLFSNFLKYEFIYYIYFLSFGYYIILRFFLYK